MINTRQLIKDINVTHNLTFFTNGGTYEGFEKGLESHSFNTPKGYNTQMIDVIYHLLSLTDTGLKTYFTVADGGVRSFCIGINLPGRGILIVDQVNWQNFNNIKSFDDLDTYLNNLLSKANGIN